jgi:hypothetical protein
MSIYATLWSVQFPRYGDYYVGCELKGLPRTLVHQLGVLVTRMATHTSNSCLPQWK